MERLPLILRLFLRITVTPSFSAVTAQPSTLHEG